MTQQNDLTLRLPDGRDFLLWEQSRTYDREIHVNGADPNASDVGDGTAARPLKTIQAAADRAGPGTRVWIHGGVYRECVRPVRGGEDPGRMVSYEAWNREDVDIRASEVVDAFSPSTGWSIQRGFTDPSEIPESLSIWEMTPDPGLFSGYNPFCAVNIIHDRLYIRYGETDMTPFLNRRGMVFIDGVPMKQVPLFFMLAKEDNTYWVESDGQRIHFRLAGDDAPEGHLVEISVRAQCFAPETPHLGYIHVRGLRFSHAAMGAPVPQRGALSSARGHHWIVEDCEVHWANALGMDFGNECWHRELLPEKMPGHSIVRRCVIRDAGVCGIAAIRSEGLLLEDNLIEGTGWQKMELAWESAGIKLHHAYHALIRRNVIRRQIRCDALWLDVGNVNCRITGNLFLDGRDAREHVFIEATRDADNALDNNIIWQVNGRFDPASVPAEPGSSGWYKNSEAGERRNGYGVYLEGTDQLRVTHNLIGACAYAGFHAKTVAFRIIQGRGGTCRDNALVNNLFADCGVAAMVLPNPHQEVEGNAYSGMPGGHLRVMHPEPELCLDLPAWQRMTGFDRTGRDVELDLSVDAEALTMEVRRADGLKYVTPKNFSDTDLFGGARGSGCLPGPLQDLPDRVGAGPFSIDPRHSDSDAGETR